MFDGFVLYGPNIDSGKNSIGQIIKFAMAINVSLAKTSLTMSQFATPQTQIALGSAVAIYFLQPSFY